MQFDNQKTRNVADVVAKILAGESAKQEPKMLEEELKGQQHKIDANKNNKIDAHDFKLLRAKKEVKKEEVEKIEELKKSTLGSYVKKASKDLANQSFDHGEDEHRQYGDPEDTEREDEMKKRERDIENRQKGINRAATKLSKEGTEEYMTFSEMLAAYKEHGLAVIAEEPDNEQFTKELKDQEASMMGKKKQPSVSAASTQGVKQMPEETQSKTHNQVQVIDMTDANEIKVSTIDLEERSLTKPEAKKKEEVVKSMKKKMPGFKERYGERAKNVMYATATRIAKEKA